ncbi:MAG: aldo/keto reductase [Chloroflexi bacterium]|nr:aldo/keto reductase [Chloroflexota bacterium]
MIPKLEFGRSGHLSTRTLFGAAAVAGVTQAEADRTLDLLLEYGVNHIDTAASYGESELRIGPWMAQHRNDFFLATKVEKRTYQDAWDSIRRSLERLRVDHVDLLQLHHVSYPDIWEQVMGEGGALQAALEAKSQGLTRFIGVTGHDTEVAAMHLRSLEIADFDSVLLPYSYILMQNPQYAADFEALVAVCRQRNVAVQTIKSLVHRPWGERTATRSTWYEPLEDQADVDLAVHWVLGNPNLFLNTAGDIHVLPKVLDAASRFDTRPTDETMDVLLQARKMAPLFPL